MAEGPGDEAGLAEEYYAEALEVLEGSGVPFMVGGAYALRCYTGIVRDTKDFDVFCTPGDYPRLLAALAEAGYRTEVTDANWIAKAFKGDHFVDLIFDSANGMCPVDETWLEYAVETTLLDYTVRLIPPVELLRSKMYVADRFRYDGADVMHIILKRGEQLDWHRLLSRMDRDWELLYSYLVLFRFVYPSEREAVPRWLWDELARRFQLEDELPVPQDRVCRGPLLSRSQYLVDVAEWGFKAQSLAVMERRME